TGCTNLKNVTFEEGTEIIPASIFSRCPGPMEIYLPESITTIGKGAFYASGITNITISNNLKTIKYGAFSSCSSLSVVNYRGNENEWRLISIESGNDAIKNIIPTYNYED
ncbi:MAG: leucine-rich repeat domain-containing protein, partial [Clostridia bacterium]|nr:leucine-rich repeat domain-containing protein [Clostridia bacterium]